MCTSFVQRKGNIMVAMNFDNNGMDFEISTKDPQQFTILITKNGMKIPSFGVNSDGTFINHLIVDANGKGIYRRPSKKVTHTSKLVKEVLNKTIKPEDLQNYLQNIEVVNVPDYSAHCMISDKEGNVWVVEPGRGNFYSPMEESDSSIMSNFSLFDYKTTGVLEGSGVDRYKKVETQLNEGNVQSVEDAFNILEAVKQSDGEWVTVLSMVYSAVEHAVYYCFNGQFSDISKYSFEA